MIRYLPLLPALFACSTPEAPWAAPDGPGPYDVGVRTWVALDEARDVPMTIEVWYPAVADPNAELGGYAPLKLPGAAQRDTLVDTTHAPYPVVAFSHGYGGMRYQSAALCERIASHGFVVVSVDHPHNTMFDLDADATPEVAVNRPGDVSFGLDEVVRRWGDNVVRDDGFGMVGHSFGALTSMMVGGGEVDISGVQEHCETAHTQGCNFFDLAADIDASAAVPDPRVQAVAALAPGGWYLFGDEGQGLGAVRNPLVIAGDNDADLDYETELRPSWSALDTGSPLLTLRDAGHWAFSDLCAVVSTIEDCAGADTGYMEPDRVLALTQTAVVAHLQLHVAQETRSESWTLDSAWQLDDVSWERSP